MVDDGSEVLEASVLVEVVGDEPPAEEITSTTTEGIPSTTTVTSFDMLGITEIVNELEASIKVIEDDAMIVAEQLPTPIVLVEVDNLKYTDQLTFILIF